MTIYNREDPRTVLPQLEKQFNGKIEEVNDKCEVLDEKIDYNAEHAFDYEEFTPTFAQCTNGAYTRCYKVGNLAMLSFNINITTATTSYDYIKGLPKAIGDFACVGGRATSPTSAFRITADGTLRSDGTPTTGWHNGSVVYICE